MDSNAVNIPIQVDTSALETSITELKVKLSGLLAEAKKADSTAAFKAINQQIAQTKVALDNAKTSLAKFNTEAKNTKTGFENAGKSAKNFNQEAGKVATLRTQYRAALVDLQQISDKFGETSVEAAAAAKKVAELGDRIGDANKLVSVFNPDEKFTSLKNSINGVIGVFQIATSAQALFGVESEDATKVLVKLQAAMALTQGLNSISEMQKSFKNLVLQIKTSEIYMKANAAATNLASGAMKMFGFSVETTSVSFKVLKGAIAATGIGLLVIAVGELIAHFDDLKEYLFALVPGLKLVADVIESIISFVTDLGDKIAGVNSGTKAYNETLKDYQSGASELIVKQEKLNDLIERSGAGFATDAEAVKYFNENFGENLGYVTEAYEVYNKLNSVYEGNITLGQKLIEINGMRAQSESLIKMAADKSAESLSLVAKREFELSKIRAEDFKTYTQGKTDKVITAEQQAADARSAIQSKYYDKIKKLDQDYANISKQASDVKNKADVAEFEIRQKLRKKDSDNRISDENVSKKSFVTKAENELKILDLSYKQRRAIMVQEVKDHKITNDALLELDKAYEKKRIELKRNVEVERAGSEQAIASLQLQFDAEDKAKEEHNRKVEEGRRKAEEARRKALEKQRKQEEEALKLSLAKLKINYDERLAALREYTVAYQQAIKDEIQAELDKYEEITTITEDGKKVQVKTYKALGMSEEEYLNKKYELNKKRAEADKKIFEIQRDYENRAIKASDEKAVLEAKTFDETYKAKKKQLEDLKSIAAQELEINMKKLQDDYNNKKLSDQEFLALQVEYNVAYEKESKNLEDFEKTHQGELTKIQEEQAQLRISNLENELGFKMGLMSRMVFVGKDDADKQKALLIETFNAKLVDLQNQYEKEKQLAEQNGQDTTEITRRYNQQKIELQQGLKDAESEINQLRVQGFMNAADAIGNVLGAASELAGKETKKGKFLAAAEATINSLKSATQVLAAPMPGPPPIALAIKIASAAAALMSGYANVKKIYSVKIPGQDSGGGGSTPAATPASSVSQMASQLSAPQLFGIGGQQIFDPSKLQAQKVFVTEQDISRAQSRVNQVRKASIQGG